MKLNKILPIVILIIIAVLSAFYVGEISLGLSKLIEKLLNIWIRSYSIQFFLFVIASLVSLLFVRKFNLKKRVIILIVLVFVVFNVLQTRNQFYLYQVNRELSIGDMQNVPECMIEANYETFWEYLNEGCHLTVSDMIRSIFYKCLFWIIPFLVGDYLIRLFHKINRKKAKTELIDRDEV
ncbi:hypothetical protein [Fluviicola taffensis]|uniref:Uncharacterized protein n=1 Tax=Fluviicola taffensis (strain DSM 16823 / NCIMB 13979 / RW262) TaxID=755732 RepID=F2IA62_FLUTR|nr:hypothetical protein [Fluviicola taffensis]AEA45239.1 hypothetical protein Fluta_3266 [Fluviicola taffensis DSM 16823]